MRQVRGLIGAVALMASPLAAKQPAALPLAEQPEIARNPDVDRLADQFFAGVKAGKVDAALDALFATTTLWSGKTAEKQAISSQVTSATKIYGAINGFELVQSTLLGGSAMKRLYLVRHEHMVTRWELDFARTGAGWAMVYVGFDDQVRTWF